MKDHDQLSGASPRASNPTSQEAETATKLGSAGWASSPAISLPKGGGSIKGIGEKFAANPVTGTGEMTVPLATSPGRSGFGPQLSLSYDSGAGNSPFGFGWSLSLPAITRKTDKGLPKYCDAEESDVYILSGSEDLVPVLQPDGSRFEDVTTVPGVTIHRYRPRIEGLFARIERWTNQSTGEIHWRSITPDNITSSYGKTPESRVADPGDARRVFSWLICQSYDDKGNVISYEYASENDANVDRALLNERNRERRANRYLKRIKYGNRISRLIQPDISQAEWMFEVVFDYDEDHFTELDFDSARPAAEQHRLVRCSAAKSAAATWAIRPDQFSSHRAGFEVRTYRRCRRVLMFHRFPELGAEPYLVRSTEFEYSDLDYSQPVAIEAELAHQGSTRFASFIRSVTQSGFVRDINQPVVETNGVTYVTYVKKSLPPLEFEYSKAAIQDEIRDLDTGSLENLPIGLDTQMYQWVDLDGEGISGILTEQADAWFYKPNLGAGRFGPLTVVAPKPSLVSLSNGQQLVDLAGDGQLDLVAFGGATPGFYERTQDQEWERFRTFPQLPSLPWDDPNLRFVDLNGDGHADVLITQDEVFTWYPSLGEVGFESAQFVRKPVADEEQGPRLVLNDGTQSIYLTDMCGDGLTDLVRIRNGEVCYWPNLGYGRFGSKVTMDNSPYFDHPDQFTQQHIRLADIDGSGVSDIIYLGRDGVRLYFNQSGNRFSEPRRLTQIPQTDNLSSVMTADLLGNGTACLVWSSPLQADVSRPLRYIDLTGGQKPHLLVKSVNNLGAETYVHYVASTKFYLADKLAGKPWITKVPFPVHVVERVEIYDRISGNRFVTRFAYHHGYFDGVEREFRGFGMVEQWDIEEFAALNAGERFPEGTNFEKSSNVPPVLTRTWFHTGAHLDREHVSDFFAGLLDQGDTGEYYREPGLTDAEARQLLLDDSVLPPGLTIEEERESCRALKGQMLRKEIYGIDGTDKEQHPYIVTEQNFTIRQLQPKAANHHSVFFTHARESINYHYERNPADPRVAHALTLEVDSFGNVLKSAAVAYGRRHSHSDLEPRDQAKQSKLLITYTEEDVTNSIDSRDDYRAPLTCESRSFELTGLALPLGRSHFILEELLKAGTDATSLAYQENSTNGVLQKRLIEHVRALYRSNDLTSLLPLGELQSLALPFETYKLAFTPGLLARIYGDRLTNSMLETEARYVHSEGDTNWWISSGHVFYSPDPADIPAQELSHAQTHFFLQCRYRDPFHTDTVSTEAFVMYDDYDLLTKATRDALGNVITFETQDDTGNTATRIDYRTLQPYWVTDSNGNRTRVTFDALGMVVGTAVMGKPPPVPIEGDSLDTFEADLTEIAILDHLANPLNDPQAILRRASTRMVYDLFAYQRTKNQPNPQPAVVYALVRETHDSHLTPADGLKFQHGFSYSDGFGREIQKKIQAEAGPVPERGADGKIVVGVNGQPQMNPNAVSPRWVGSGWTVYNNKGQPVRQYEPFFTDTLRFEFDVRIGVSSVVFYDPVGRAVATLHPNHTWDKMVFSPWQQESWDASDMVLVTDPKDDPDVGNHFRRLPETDYLPAWYAQRESGALGSHEQAVARKAAIHSATPTRAHADSLGRTFLTVAHNKFKYSDAPTVAQPLEEFYSNRVFLDVEGNEREISDAKDRVVMRYDYDMLGARIHDASMEAGERWTLNDVAGNPVRAWDSRNHSLRALYDPLRRLTESLLREGEGSELVVARTVYGESLPNPEANNLRGQAAQLFDQAGVVTSDQYDFKGNSLRSQRQLARDYKTTLDWSTDVPLEPAIYTSHTGYDALNRPIERIAPDNSIIRTTYNEANLLERVDANLRGEAVVTTFVTGISYDANGQRMSIDYGNGVRMSYEYDPLTLRLVQLQTRRDPVSFPNDCPQSPPSGWPGCQVQKLHYTYDPVGNVTHIRDDAQQAIYFRNKRVEPSAEYTYDAVYRLIEATGREHLGQAAGPQPSSYNDQPRVRILLSANDGNAMGRYLERYVYDAVGNFQRMVHRGSDPVSPGWTRTYAYNEPSFLESNKQSNRLTRSSIGATTETYSSGGNGYNAHGSMLRMPQLQVMQWDFQDQLQMTQRQSVNATDEEGVQRQGERSWYVYDAVGERVRKVTELATGQVKDERTYLGILEVYRRQGANPIVRETLHIMDDEQPIAMVETRTHGNESGAPAQLIRYQFGNHLGSVSLELDDEAQIISFEEYTAYGTTSYQTVRNQTEAPKRYRYTGKERDEESGLYYHGARYYAPWLATWTAADPIGIEDGLNVYAYAQGNPVGLHDPTGTANVPANDTDREIMQSKDLHGLLKGMSEEDRASFADSATGAFRNRAWAELNKHGMPVGRSFPDQPISGTVPAPEPKPVPENVSEVLTLDKCYRPDREPIKGPRPIEEPLEGPSYRSPRTQPARVVARKNGEIVWGGTLQEVDTGIAWEGVGGRELKAGITLEVQPPVQGVEPSDDDSTSEGISASAAGVGRPPAGAKKSGRARSSRLANRPAHAYEIVWVNLDNPEEFGVFKIGIGRQKNPFTSKGMSKRALHDQINVWNKQLRQKDSPGARYRLLHGRIWGHGRNGVHMNSEGAHLLEKHLVTEHYQKEGRVPPGNQSPGPSAPARMPHLRRGIRRR